MSTTNKMNIERTRIEAEISKANNELDRLIDQNYYSPSEHLDNCIAATQIKIQELWAEMRTLPVSKTISA